MSRPPVARLAAAWLGAAALLLPAAAAAQQGGAPRPETPGIDARRPPLYFGAALFDQNEMRSNGRGAPIYAWEGLAFYGTDYNRVWVNTRGETARDRGGLERAEVQILYSRLLGYYWDIQGGVRHDFRLSPRGGTPARGREGPAP